LRDFEAYFYGFGGVFLGMAERKKSVEEMSDAERAALFPIVLSEYNPNWREWFFEERARIEGLIGAENIAAVTHIGSTSVQDLTENAVKIKHLGRASEPDLTGSIVSITHIGSTAVPGLTAKPTVDILLEIQDGADLERLKSTFPRSEYVRLGRQTVPTDDIMIFLKGYTAEGFAERVFHIHVRYKGNWDEIYFRDYLISHPETAAEYAELKQKLKDEYEYDRDGYTSAKGNFIKRITELAKKERKNK
jgi:GrpB-like predicted nucleotidyltransferase (UPF0157 family)